MMMPANFSAVNAEVVYGGAVADYLPDAWTAANVKTLSTNVLTILSNSFTKLLVVLPWVPCSAAAGATTA